MTENELPEPWLRGSLGDVPPVQRAVLHALQLAKEDCLRWCGNLSDEQINARPHGLASVAFHVCHISRSIDRLLTYAEGELLTDKQLALLKTETEGGANREIFSEFDGAISDGTMRIRAFNPEQLGEPRAVGKRGLPTTVAELLIHVADHTQRHVGQAITTAKLVSAQHAIS
jgi:uncharacterized damage-inducible protein DinB